METDDLSMLKVARLNFIENEDDLLGDFVDSAFLDYPKNTDIISLDKGLLSIGGWVLLKNNESSFKISVTFGQQSQKIEPNTNRYDVIKHKLNEAVVDHPQLKCGFSEDVFIDSTQLTQDGVVLLFIEINEQRLLWKQLKIEEDYAISLNILNTWKAYSLNNLSNISDVNAKILECIDGYIIDVLIIKEIKTIDSVEEACQASYFKQDEALYLKRFITDLRVKDLCFDFVDSSLKIKKCELLSPFGDGMTSCNESFHFDGKCGNLTCLRFISSTGEIFYLWQHVTSCDAIYFPNRNCLFLFEYVARSQIECAIKEFFYSFSINLEYSKKIERSFGGIIASHKRPYHLFYDVAPAIHNLNKKELLVNIPIIVMAGGGDFCSFKQLYSLTCQEMVVPLSKINKYNSENNSFFIQIGYQFSDERIQLVNEFDQFLLERVDALIDKETKEEINKASSCYPLIWFGVTGQKRMWIEQVDGGINILTRLAQDFPELGVVFDGWTSPLHPTAYDKSETAIDQAIVERIKGLLPEGVRTFSVVGSSSLRKIAFAKRIDFFVANFLTGSMNVSRFAKKTGVGHIGSKIVRAREAVSRNHIHSNTLLPSIDQILDIPDPNNSGADFTSYSIDWIIIYELLHKLIINDERTIEIKK